MDYVQLKTKAISEKTKLDVIKNELQESQRLVEQYTTDHENLVQSMSLYDMSIETFKACIVKLSEKHILHLQDLINSMLQTIFFDKDYKIKFEIEDQRNTKVLTIFLVDNTTGTEIITDIASNGGGLQTLVAFTLQVYFLLYFKQSPILFLDEALSAVSDEYLPGLMQFMKSLVDKYEFIFCAVFHDVRFDEYADTVYQINNGSSKRIR